MREWRGASKEIEKTTPVGAGKEEQPPEQRHEEDRATWGESSRNEKASGGREQSSQRVGGGRWKKSH